MSLILNAIAVLPQELLAKATGSPRRCWKCNSPYGVFGIMHGTALPCGFIVGECKKCYASLGCRGSIAAHGKQARPKCTLRDLSSAEITCPHCGAEAAGCDSEGKRDHTAVAALHAAERRLGPEQKLELRRLIEGQSSEGGLASRVEWRRDDDDGGWEQYEDADDDVKVHSVDEGLELDFNEIMEMGI